MSSQARSSRGEGRSLSLRTLVIASIASAVAAIVTSRFWRSGTPIAAAMTPVIVTIVSEALRRPSERIASRLTTDSSAPRGVPRAAQPRQGVGAAREPSPREERQARPAARPELTTREPLARPAERAGADGSGDPGGVRVYRTPRRGLPWKPIAITAALAFAVGFVALNLPGLVGASLLKGDPPLYAGDGDSSDKRQEGTDRQQRDTTDETRDENDQPAPEDPQPDPTDPAPQAPQPTTRSPAPKPQPQQPTPAPTTPAPPPTTPQQPPR